jgi:RNA polymerase sigma-70 factor (ECF subfamily)
MIEHDMISGMAHDEVTGLLRLWCDGDEAAQETLWPLVYDELRRVSAELMRGERDSHTLQPTALVSEAYIRLADQKHVRYRDRRHFFVIAARMMRRILVDHARTKQRKKRDAGIRVPIEIALDKEGTSMVGLSDLDEALGRLETMEKSKAEVVELKFFGGLNHQEVAEVMGCSERTVRRHWKVAKMWLHRELGQAVRGGA